MGNELALTENDVAVIGKGFDVLAQATDAACGLFDAITEKAAGIINHGIDFYNNRAVEEYNLQVREIEMRENLYKAECDAMIATEQTRQAAISAETERLRITEQTKQAEIQAKTERLRITEQSKCVQKALDVALKAYTRKIDFYQAQLESCDNFFRPQIAAMQNEIRYLEEKRDEAFNDTNQYVLISKRIDRITEYCDKVNTKYLKFHDNLTTAVKFAQLEAPDASAMTASINENSTKYLN